MMDHLHDMASFGWRHRITCSDVRRHTILTKKNFSLEKRVPVPKDESLQSDILNNSLLSSTSSEFDFCRGWDWNRHYSPRKMEFCNWKCSPTRIEVPPQRWLRNKVELNFFWNREPAFQSELSLCEKNPHRKGLFYLKLGRNPDTFKIIQPRTRCASFSSSTTSWSFDQGSEPQNFQSKNPSVGRTNIRSCRHSETCGDHC